MKKLSMLLIATVLIALCVFLLPKEAEAASESDLEFYYENGAYASYVVTHCEESASGTLTIPSTYDDKPVTGIGYAAFMDCAGLTSVTIPNSVTYIDSYAFEGCTSLISISIPDSVTYIGGEVFNNCTSLSTVIYCGTADQWSQIQIHQNNSALTDANLQFHNCENGVCTICGIGVDWEYDIVDGGVSITGYTGSETTLTIPDTIENLPVKFIGMFTFTDCSGLTRITIPSNVNEIDMTGMVVFKGCTGLTAIVVEEENLSYASDARGVLYNKDMTELYYAPVGITGEYSVPDGVTRINWYAFQNCSRLTGISIPDSVTDIGVLAFSGCSSLASVAIPDGVQIIYDREFENCTALTSVAIPNSVTEIHGSAFTGCSNLTTVVYCGTAEQWGQIQIGENNAPLTSANRTYHDFGEFNGTTPPVCSYCGVVYDGIPASAFLTGPNTVRAGDTITLTLSLNGSGISGVSGKLSYDSYQLTLVETQQVIGNDWAVEWYGNNFIVYDDSVDMNQPINSNTAVFQLIFDVSEDLPAGTAVTVSAINVKSSDGDVDTDIGTVSYTKTIVLPIFEYSIIDGDACITGYNGDGGLVTIPGVIDGYTVTQIGDYAFEGCTNITGIVIPDSITGIGEMAFYNCSALSDITMGRNVAIIKSAAFLGCDNLKNVYVYDASAWCNIGYETAYSMPTHLGAKPQFLDENGNLLNHLILDDTVTEIPSYAFVGFSQMHSITIPGSVTRIGNNAFTGCSALKDIYITDLSAWLKMFATTVDSHPLAINANEKRMYLNGTLITDLVIPGDIRRIPANAFYYCTSIETVTFHDKVDDIGENAFARVYPDLYVTDPNAWCHVDFLPDLSFRNVIILDAQGNLVTDLVLDSTVTSIPRYAFKGCQSIQRVTIPSSVTSIGGEAFLNCQNLTALNIGNRVQTISGRAFEGCANLLTVELPASVNSVGVDAFRGCDRLNIFYAGTKAQISNTESGGIWHYEVEDAIFADQECYYCGDCDTYLNAFGNKILATVVFEDYDGTVIDTQQYPYKATITAPADPVRVGNQVATYIFTGWNESVGTCTGNVTFTATYRTQYVEYLVKFEDEDGTVLSSKIYHWGDEITVPADPTKVSDNIYHYAFDGWNQEIVNCAGNATYKATYKANYREYVVEFKNWNDVVISSETYHWGDKITLPVNPVKAADNTYTYTFAGWDKEVVDCAGNATYEATYTPVYIEYTVVFKNWDDSIISTKTYHWGEAVSVPANPTRPNEGGYSYTFAGWDKTIVNCAGNATYKATYSAKALVPNTITSSKYTVSNGMISKIEQNTTASTLISNLNEGQHAKIYKGNQEVTGSTVIGTGMVVKIMDGTTVKASATIVVTGDTNGDGKINIADMLAAKAHVLEKTILKNAYAKAGDVNADGKVDITDFLQLKAHVLGKREIEPKSAVMTAEFSAVSSTPVSVVSVQKEVPAVCVLSCVQNDAIVPDRKSAFAL